MNVKETIQKMIALDEEIANLRQSLDDLPKEQLEEELTNRFSSMLDKFGEEDPISVGLIRIAELLLSLGNTAAARLLTKGIMHSNHEINMLCEDAFLHIAGENLDIIAPLIDEALEKDSDLAEELPFLLSEVENPEVTALLIKFLGHKKPEIVAPAIESLAESGDTSAIPALKKLLNDKRTVAVETDDGQEENWTIGKLSEEALDILQEE